MSSDVWIDIHGLSAGVAMALAVVILQKIIGLDN